MIRAMYSGISGLRANQTKLDVIGNNIANVGTTAFKNQRIRFQDMLSQNVREATGPGRTIGGTNPSQVGLGVQVAGIDTTMTQGNMQPTGGMLDVAIDGDGFFIVGKGDIEGKITIDTSEDKYMTIKSATDMETMFSRDGAFKLDYNGNLINSDGLRVLGYAFEGYEIEDGKVKLAYVDAEDKELKPATEDELVPLAIPDEIEGEDGEMKRVKSFSIDKNGLIKAVLSDNTVTAVGQIAMASFKNPEGMTKAGKNIWQNSANSGPAVIRTPVGTEGDSANDEGYGDLAQGMLEMSNVDLAEQFSEMIVASRAFQANGKIITTSDEILQELVNLKR
ncbi:flagellar hook protein FlgE [Clostridium pascui]|uniref:flagellar hook-basal body complex protein n=1 Tax=Clostridium pascui TaxID=46609 RepID=UPI00195F1C9E|nr:flagellar hook-basal body complex protein [Clostridium pascui]MBM7869411.1 flagellar hook protein FlgE [Clostridium pascui]